MKNPLTSPGIFFFASIFIGSYTLQSWKVDSCSLLMSLCGILYVVSPPVLVIPWGGVFVFQGCVVAVLFTTVSGCNESGARGGGAKAPPGTCLLWVSRLVDGTLSSGHVSGNPCNRQERGVAVSRGGMLLGGPRSILSSSASVGVSNGKSGVEPPTFRFVAQHHNHCATAVPTLHSSVLKCKVKEGYECPGVTLFIKVCLLSVVIYRVIRNDCLGFNNLPPRSPDATPCDFFLWGYVKDQVYVPPLPASIPELKVRIRTAHWNHHRWHATDSLERTRLSCWCL